MAARRKTAAKPRPRRRKPPLNVLNTAVTLVQANAAVHAFTNTGIWGFFIAPWMRDAALNPKVDNAIDSRELFSLIQGQNLGGSMTRFSAGVFEAGRSPGTAGLSAVFIDNLKKNAIPATLTIVGADVFKRGIKRLKLLTPLNKVTKMLGFQKDVRWA